MFGDGSQLLSLKLPPVSVFLFYAIYVVCIYNEYRLGIKYFVEIEVI